MLSIGSRVYLRGYEGVVIGNSHQSYYGYCPESMVIVRLPSGDTLAEIVECELIQDIQNA